MTSNTLRRIVGRGRLLTLKLGAPVMAGFGCAKRPDDITVLAAGHVIVLFALSEVTTAPEADLVMTAGQAFLLVLHRGAAKLPFNRRAWRYNPFADPMLFRDHRLVRR